jgi:hypothetical protein
MWRWSSAGLLRGALRREATHRLLRRAALPTPRRGSPAAGGQTETTGTPRPRVRAAWHGLRAHGLRALDGLAAYDHCRATSRLRVRRRGALFGRVAYAQAEAFAWYATTSRQVRPRPSTRPTRRSKRGAWREESSSLYTPVAGSWRNMVEVALSVLVRQCLKCRLPDIETLRRAVSAWTEERNRLGASLDWRFTTPDARVKLRNSIHLLGLDGGLGTSKLSVNLHSPQKPQRAQNGLL